MVMLQMHQYGQNGKIYLKKTVLFFYPITFYKSDDKCGSAADHAKELNIQIQQILNNMTMTSWKAIKRLLYNKD
jgi:hypothetical protein